MSDPNPNREAPSTALRIDLGADWVEIKRIGESAILSSNLRISEADAEYWDSWNASIDGVESLLLSLFHEGVDLSTEPVRRALKTTLEAIANNYS